MLDKIMGLLVGFCLGAIPALYIGLVYGTLAFCVVSVVFFGVWSKVATLVIWEGEH